MSAEKPLVTKLDPKFGKWLRGTRSGIPMTALEFSRAAGLNDDTVRNLELGRRLEGQYSIALFVRIAETLGMELGYVLHKAGLDIGRDGITLSRLRRVEALAEGFIENERQLRYVLAEALTRADNVSAPDDEMIVEIGRALAGVDRISERLRREGFIATAVSESEPALPSRPWSESDRAFLVNNPNLSHEDAGKQLGRTAVAVRQYRRRMNGGSA